MPSRRLSSAGWAACGGRWLAALSSVLPRPSAPASIRNGRSWPAMSLFLPCSSSGRAASFRAPWISPAMAAPASTQMPQRSRVATGGRSTRFTALAAVALILVALALPGFVGRDVLQDLFFVATMLALAEYWNLLAGYAGLVSIGQQAFVGLGAYSLFGATIAGLDPLLAIPVAGLVAALCALPTAL